MMKTIAVAAATLASLSLVLAACGGDDGGGSNQAAPNKKTWQDEIKGGPLEVGVLPAKGTSSLDYLQQLAAGLEKDYKGTKVTLTFANTEARPALEQRWRSGDPLDVDYVMFDGTNPALQSWAEDGALLDLRPYLEQKDPETGQPWLDRFAPAALKFMKSPDSDAIYAVPSELSVHVLFYDAGLFKENSITPPTTWDELMDAVDGLKAAGVDPIALTGLYEPYMGMWSDHLWLRTVGYDKARAVLTEGKGHITDDPGFLDGLQKLQDLRDAGGFLKGFEGTDFTAAQAQFFQGKAGMILMGSWLVSEMKDVIPPDFELGVLPFPTVPGGSGDQQALMTALQQMSISADSENIPLALEWARRLTSPAVQTERAEKLGDTSAVLGVPSPPGMPGIDQVIAGADRLEARDYGILQSEANEVVYPEIARMLFGKQDAQQTLDRLDKGLRRVHGN